jgi:hypothetical protein
MVIREPVPAEIDDSVKNTRLTVEPVNSPETDPLYLVLFTDLGRPQSSAEFPSQPSRIALHEGASAGDGRGI